MSPALAFDSESSNPSFVLNKVHDVTFENRPVPTLLTEHDAIVCISFTGICGSDVHYWEHGHIGKFVVDAPMVLGHESSGIIHSVGSAVKHLVPGDGVALEPGIPCLRCSQCKSNAYNICSQVQFAATPPVDGTLCRFYRLPADFCHLLPSNVSLEEGALIEPLAVAVHIVRLANVCPGLKVVVYGAGPVGLLCMAVAKAYGATTVVAVDINPTRLEFAKSYAATHIFSPAKHETSVESAARLQAQCKLDSGADVAIEASGAEPCMHDAVHVCRAGATYVQAGMGRAEVQFPMMAAVSKELKILTSFRYKQGDYETAVMLVGSGKVEVRPLISARFSFLEAEQAFQTTKAAVGNKVLIEGPRN